MIHVHDSIAHMFETEDFARRIRAAFSQEARRNGMDEYETAIIKYLQRLAMENEKILMEQEVKKAAGQRRGVSDAVQSVVVLAKAASEYAFSDERTTVRLDDIQSAYRAKFCQVWPFCKK